MWFRFINAAATFKKKILVAIKKCKFYIKKTNYIGFIIKPRQISMDLKKIKAIINQQELKSIIGLKLILEFYNYYRKFITKQLNKIEPFTKITK